jgi:hypothetical protein
MTSLPQSPFPASPAEGVFRGLVAQKEVPSDLDETDRNVYAPAAFPSVLSGVREAERSERVAVGELGEGVDLVDLAYHAPANGTVVRQVGEEISDRVKEAHEAQVEELDEKRQIADVLKDEFEIQLGWNPQTGAMDAMMDGKVMTALRMAGAVVVIKGRFEF